MVFLTLAALKDFGAGEVVNVLEFRLRAGTRPATCSTSRQAVEQALSTTTWMEENRALLVLAFGETRHGDLIGLITFVGRP